VSTRGPLGFDDADEPPRAEPSRPSEPERPPAPPSPPPARASRYGWFLGVALVLLIAVAILNGIRTEGPGSRGVEVGERLPPFAVPLALGDLEGEANVATPGNTSDAAGTRPACEVRGAAILNVCELAERGPVVLAFLATRSGTCVRAMDRLERVRRRFPQVQFAAVAIRGDRERLREIVRARGWGFPVGYDADGVLANLYGVAVCPQITYAERGGEVADTSFGELTETDLTTRVRSVAGSR
jgi:hypothetical protein